MPLPDRQGRLREGLVCVQGGSQPSRGGPAPACVWGRDPQRERRGGGRAGGPTGEPGLGGRLGSVRECLGYGAAAWTAGMVGCWARMALQRSLSGCQMVPVATSDV